MLNPQRLQGYQMSSTKALLRSPQAYNVIPPAQIPGPGVR
jgi:hypothetical protein